MEEPDNEMIYTLSDEADASVDKDIETMDEWMTLLSDKEFAVYHKMCNKNPDERSDEDNFEISKYALILYCRELGLKTLAVTNELIVKITGMFSINIIIESLRREGYATTEGSLLIYKDTKITLTEKGKKHLEDIASEDKNEEK